jgi:GDP-4-dehydro-6-deoxy-D-mannose reductase
MMLFAEKGNEGDVYNVSGEKVYLVKDIIPLIEKVVGIKLNVQVDQQLIRPSDEPIIFGDSSKLKKDTGWQQKFSLGKR